MWFKKVRLRSQLCIMRNSDIILTSTPCCQCITLYKCVLVSKGRDKKMFIFTFSKKKRDHHPLFLTTSVFLDNYFFDLNQTPPPPSFSANQSNHVKKWSKWSKKRSKKIWVFSDKVFWIGQDPLPFWPQFFMPPLISRFIFHQR